MTYTSKRGTPYCCCNRVLHRLGKSDLCVRRLVAPPRHLSAGRYIHNGQIITTEELHMLGYYRHADRQWSKAL